MWTLHHVRHWSESTGSVAAPALLVVERLQVGVGGVDDRRGGDAGLLDREEPGHHDAVGRDADERLRHRVVTESLEVEKEARQLGLVAGRQRRHPPQAELLIVDQGHGCPLLCIAGLCISRPQRGPELGRRAPEHRRVVAHHHEREPTLAPLRARPDASPTAVPQGNPRAAVAASSLSVEILQLGRTRRGSPLDSDRSPVPRKTAVSVGHVEDFIHLGERLDVLELHASHGVVAASEVVGVAR